ncbi:DUF488 family protein [Verrucomicrobium sp. BvORR106]|uniref:DUF488 domain-containing protein n=1 Tax=Verrucomicrobium sp. BvORR106 TaxID=1403819 RepID=UPI0005714C26|nr:DUF488 family protein [Verrucomicrobium sp. BvORR106]
MPLHLKTYQAGSARKRGEGLRIGVVRYLPRGVVKQDYAKLDYFDVWLPLLAPSRKLLGSMKKRQKEGEAWPDIWPDFRAQYEREIQSDTERRQTLLLLAKLAEKTPLVVGCYCENESLCHRSILLELIQQAAKSST